MNPVSEDRREIIFLRKPPKEVEEVMRGEQPKDVRKHG